MKCIYGYKLKGSSENESKTHCVLHRAIVGDALCAECPDKSETESPKWIKTQERIYDELLITEIKCPYCGYKQTFHGKPRELICYVCGNYSEYKETDSD